MKKLFLLLKSRLKKLQSSQRSPLKKLSLSFIIDAASFIFGRVKRYVKEKDHRPAEEEATNAVIEKVEALIARVGGTVEKVDRWGKRRLAYAVKKFTDGFYVLINFEAAPAEIKEIDRVLKINDEVLRHLIVKHEA